VIDTKSTRGRLRVEKRGGFFSPRHKVLLINGRDRTHLVDGLERQLVDVRSVLAELSSTPARWTFGARSASRTSTDDRD
jgi:hypothetical protein